MKKTTEMLRTYMIMNNTRAYSTEQGTTEMFLNRLFKKIENTTHLDPHPSLIIGTHHFNEPHPLVNETHLLSLATMDLLKQFAYPSISGYSKFTISIRVLKSYGEEITFTIGNAIPLTMDDGNFIPINVVYSHIYESILRYAEVYDGLSIVLLMIRVYMEEDKKEGRPALSIDDRYISLSSINHARLSKTEPITAREIIHKKKDYPGYITAIKKGSKELKPFIVSDLETILIDNVHKPYAAGLMMVHPGIKINEDMIIHTYFSEDYCIIKDSFEERSTKLLIDMVCKIEALVRQEKKAKIIYFHNLGRFDGIILLKHLACYHNKYTLKPLMRNNRLYELAVYSGKKMLFCFRDSLNLLPGKLNDLAKNLCPVLGAKGSIEHDKLNLSNLASKKESLLDYMKQDILLLGGVMQNAQEIYWKLYQLDIESKITLSSLALSIFRLRYYNDKKFPIHIPNKNEDSFIRKAYYGGHTDTYIPYGEDLYYYDINSLYPFVMKEFPMPGGVPVWNGNLKDKNLDSMFGFIKAYVVCPKTIKKPFLPYRDKNGTLIFPTGEFLGVYYSEELKYAVGIGYKVIPISGYLFERKESPFKDFVSSLFSSRLEARKEGNEALSYVYKILMNSLYGRFGINPKSTTTVVCNSKRYKHLFKKDEFIYGDKLSEDCYIVSYHVNTGIDEDYWNPPTNSAVQLAAAITANARIYMYPYISREDSYYTDTDSVVLGQPLPEEVISSSVLGMFKLEDRISKGFFLAPKSYCYYRKDGTNVIKYKGQAKNMVNPEWFESQYADPSRKQQVNVEANFRIEWKNLNIIKKEISIGIGIKEGSKRIPVYRNNVWVDTEPINIHDLSSIDYTSSIKVIESLSDSVTRLEKVIVESQKEEELTEVTNPTLDEKPKTGDEKPKTDEEIQIPNEKTHTDDEIHNTIPNTNEKTKTDKKTNTDEEIPNTDKKKPP